MKLLRLNKKLIAMSSVMLASMLYAVCVPCVKILNGNVPDIMMGGLLYLGAGFGLIFTTLIKEGKSELSLTKKELPYIVAMILLDITAIMALMFGISKTTGANASLLGNFELAATSLAAFFIFKEKISSKLFAAIILITIASIILSYEGSLSFEFSLGSVLVLISCILWGFENNCTRMLSSKDTRQITIIKGCFSGLGILIIAFIAGETIPQVKWIILVLLLGFISYGISVSLYIYSQRFLGAAKTSAFYSSAPFLGVLFSMLILHERPLMQFYIALFIMLAASILVINDTHNS